jgi:hypothetical protein
MIPEQLTNCSRFAAQHITTPRTRDECSRFQHRNFINAQRENFDARRAQLPSRDPAVIK